PRRFPPALRLTPPRGATTVTIEPRAHPPIPSRSAWLFPSSSPGRPARRSSQRLRAVLSYPFNDIPSSLRASTGARWWAATFHFCASLGGVMAAFSQQKVRVRLEQLDERIVPAVQATFNSGTLLVQGDAANNNIVVKADADGNLQVTEQGQAVSIRV